MHEIVRDYYGKQLQNSDYLKTSACCDVSQVPDWLKPLLARIPPEVLSRCYGFGLVCPPLLAGCRILDLGSGSGRDVYALAHAARHASQITLRIHREFQHSLWNISRLRHRHPFCAG